MPKLYFIDDCQEAGKLTLKALAERFGNDVVEGTEEPFEAVIRWRSTLYAMHDLPKVVVLDIEACQGQGMEVLKKLKSHPKTCKIKVLVHTQSEEIDKIAAAYVFGADQLVLKFPFNPEANTALFETCEQWLNPEDSAVHEADPS